ncbi:carcinine hydrolase/isopenicillin-N N-acyltransferase family protein [Paenibacillus sp. 598K]|uniref:carcinine hydrolase/isopenicillin-N N-acyltransferase family protein n=1 Tax=Paenibacillus sp. 598K TaxID=1117987 RepID=UPI0035E3C37F
MLARTSVTGKYTHMGTSTMSFGRDDGFNEHGLAVTIQPRRNSISGLPTIRCFLP